MLNILFAALLMIAGYILAKRASQLLERALNPYFSRHHAVVISRCIFYLFFLIFFVTSLQHLGFNLSVLLGAAGVFTVAISFASQTAASNLISGIFLLFERPFKVGDSIEINSINGVVDSIDLLSTKLITSDNKLIRIPNETLIKSSITNLSYFKTRRVDLLINVTFESNISTVKSLLLTMAQNNPDVIKEPMPTVIVNRYTSTSIEFKLMAWAKTSKASALKNEFQETIKHLFDQRALKFPVFIPES